MYHQCAQSWLFNYTNDTCVAYYIPSQQCFSRIKAGDASGLQFPILHNLTDGSHRRPSYQHLPASSIGTCLRPTGSLLASHMLQTGHDMLAILESGGCWRAMTAVYISWLLMWITYSMSVAVIVTAVDRVKGCVGCCLFNQEKWRRWELLTQ